MNLVLSCLAASSSPTETKVPASQSWCVIGDLHPRTPYIFQVLAVNEVGASGASSTVQATTQEEGEWIHSSLLTRVPL